MTNSIHPSITTKHVTPLRWLALAMWASIGGVLALAMLWLGLRQVQAWRSQPYIADATERLAAAAERQADCLERMAAAMERPIQATTSKAIRK